MGWNSFTLALIRKSLVIIFVCFFSLISFADHFDTYIQSINNEKWAEAERLAKKQNSTYLVILSKWLKLTKSKSNDFYELKEFIIKYPSWPDIENLKRKIEECDFKNVKNSEILEWFNLNEPKTILGKRKYVELLADGDKKTALIKEIWKKSNFKKDEQQAFLKLYKNSLDKKSYKQRIEYQLYNNNLEQANLSLSLLSDAETEVYKTAIKIQQGKIIKIDTKFNKHPLVLMSLAYYYNKIEDDESLIKVLTYASEDKNLEQKYIWKYKAKVIRNLVQNKKYFTAYLFASTHGTEDAADYSEAEWLAGWIALQKLDKADIALKHFTKILEKVKKPISISRAKYWLARAYEVKKDKINSEKSYDEASKYFNTFYGQIASCKLYDCIVDIQPEPKIIDEDKIKFNKNNFVRIAILLNDSVYKQYVQKFIYKAIDGSDSLGEIALITRLGFELSHDHLSVEAAKHASYKDIHIINSNYPILESVYEEHEVDPALVMALIRQESVFNKKAVSSAGALGLMQLMPHVAKQTAKELDIKYHQDKLTSDVKFNTRLGIHHLDGLLAKYDNSYVLTIAAYNAGDKPALEWIAKNGDPRGMHKIEQVIDWVEMITYYETRNYVQRVLEGKSVYHVLMYNDKKLPIVSDLIK